MKYFLVCLVKFYQWMPFKSHDLCRHYPRCSDYMIEALKIHGTIKGLKLGIKRISRCRPKGTYGYDPVPRKEGN